MTTLHPYVVVLVLVALVASLGAVRALQYRPAPGASALAVMLAAVTEWLLLHAAEVAATDWALKLLFADLQWVGVVVIPVALLAFVLDYTGRSHLLTRRYLPMFAAEPVLAVLLLVGNDGHNLLWSDPTPTEVAMPVGDTITVVTATPHLATVGHAVFAWVLLAVATLLLFQRIVASPALFRLQSGTVVVGMVVPWLVSVLAVARVTVLDLTPLAFAVTGVAFLLGLFRYDLFELVPVAHGAVVSNVGAGVLVFDRRGRLVDANDRALALLDADERAVVGSPVAELFADYPTVVERFEGETDTSDRIAVDLDGERRHFDVQVRPVRDAGGRTVGAVAVAHDVTESVQRERDLERTNERLERTNARLERANERLESFAGIVSHDLRNPLTVAAGNLDFARDTGDPEHFDAVEHAHDRMAAIVDDVLTVAREGEVLEVTESVPLAAVARDAWAIVDTGDATLTVDTDRVVETDRDRLARAFENLFRNSVEHGSTSSRQQADDSVEHGTTATAGGPAAGASDVDRAAGAPATPAGDLHVRVGDTPDGFYVADDGPGIPAAERDHVFEFGASTSEGGTGFGLAIVQAIVEAHGWSVRATESESGGARFDVTVDADDRAVSGPQPGA
jgi:PAS domain S-box-containing protein